MGRNRREKRKLKEAAFHEPIENPVCEVDPVHGEAKFMSGGLFRCDDCHFEWVAENLPMATEAP